MISQYGREWVFVTNWLIKLEGVTNKIEPLLSKKSVPKTWLTLWKFELKKATTNIMFGKLSFFLHKLLYLDNKRVTFLFGFRI